MLQDVILVGEIAAGDNFLSKGQNREHKTQKETKKKKKKEKKNEKGKRNWVAKTFLHNKRISGTST